MSLDEPNQTTSEAPVAEEQAPPEKRAPANQSGPANQGSTPPKDAEKKKSSIWIKIIALLVIVLLIAGGIYYYLATKDQEETDDAYTDGRAITISPKISGYAVQLLVNDNQFVKAGQVLVKIDDRDYVVARDNARAALITAQAQKRGAEFASAIARKNFPARLLQAQGELQQAQGQLFQAQTDYKRQHSIDKAATTQQSVDTSTANLQLAQGRVTAAQAAVDQAEPVQDSIGQTDQQVSQIDGQIQQAQAQLAQAELNLSYTIVTAPQDGWITKRNVEMGNYLQSGASIFSIVTPEVWVTANFKESQLNRMRPGQKVNIAVDAYPGLNLVGHVDSIQLGSGSKFTAFPPENATGNFVKIVQRVPVKIDIDSGLDPNLPLPLGISVEPTVLLK